MDRAAREKARELCDTALFRHHLTEYELLRQALDALDAADAEIERLKKHVLDVFTINERLLARKHDADSDNALLQARVSELEAAQGWRPTIKSAEMPAPDTVVEYNHGMSAPAMFHYATEGCNVTHIARDQGFEISFRTMECDLDPSSPLHKVYENGDLEEVLNSWKPAVPEGWKLAGKNDSEDGPVAILLRPLHAPTVGDR
jgi:hypothetical protein